MGEFGLVCDDFWDIPAGHVVCRQLGYSSAVQAVTAQRNRDYETRPILLDDVSCTGMESNLGDCVAHFGSTAHDCSWKEAAALYCEPPRESKYRG